MQFTQEIKDNWIAALKSGSFKQGFHRLVDKADNSFCCIGVLGEVTEGLSNYSVDAPGDPYAFLQSTIGKEALATLYETNDADSGNDSYPRDYSNVLPIVENLPTSEN